jgi:hypothetical protein
MTTLLDADGVLVVNLEKEKEVRILDPRGMIGTDIKFIQSKLPQLCWQKGMSLEEIAYIQGQHDLLKFIEQKVVGRRLS